MSMGNEPMRNPPNFGADLYKGVDPGLLILGDRQSILEVYALKTSSCYDCQVKLPVKYQPQKMFQKIKGLAA